jgi:hypothetical protein
MGNAVYGNASHGAVTVTTSATQIAASPLGNRTNIVIYNNDASATLYLGFGSTASTVTTATGYPVPPGSNINLDFGPQIQIYGISTASISVRYSEAY